ncbi:PRA1 family protein F3-like isoform X3 [Cucurbita moschata]|uniref:PRA1 family protein n=1 Tax=Cucurbita moschata TaxID=3662 RepID=A0A6J1EDS5_CUCMO|nr:PRA1 family protein F3-like isoform X3 [Cucurbita moschata]
MEKYWEDHPGDAVEVCSFTPSESSSTRHSPPGSYWKHGRAVDDRLVMVVLSLVTVALLFFTHATKNIIISMSIGVVMVFVHGALKGSEDIFSLDEEGLSECAGGRGVIKMPLKHAASASFSLS